MGEGGAVYGEGTATSKSNSSLERRMVFKNREVKHEKENIEFKVV